MRVAKIVALALLAASVAACGESAGTHVTAGSASSRGRPLTEASLLTADEYGLARRIPRTLHAAGSRAAVRAALLREGLPRQAVDPVLDDFFEVKAGDAQCVSKDDPLDVAFGSTYPEGGVHQVVFRFSSDAVARRVFHELTTTCRYPVLSYKRCGSGDDCAWGDDNDGLDEVIVRVGPLVTSFERVDADWKVPIQRLAPRLADRLR